MAASFNQSIRSLAADKFRPMLLVTIFAAVILTAWGIWFFAGSVTLFERTQAIRITPAGVVEAVFTPAQAAKIRVGQSGWLRLAGEGEAAGFVPLLVVAVATDGAAQKSMVSFYVADEALYPAVVGSAGSAVGRVEVVVEQISPARLVLRSTGRQGETPPVALTN